MHTPPSYAHTRVLQESLPPSEGAFTLLSWNLLADGLAESGGFCEADPEALSWSARRGPLLEQVLSGEHSGVAPDLVCLQELDHFADTFEPALHAKGYTGAFVPKAAGRDGCAVFFLRERFQLRWVRTRRYLDEDQRNATQVALLVAVHDRLLNRPLLVVTTHLKAKLGFEELRGHQAQQLRETALAARRALGPDCGVLIAGDFNDVPGSLAHAAMLAGPELQSSHAACTGHEPDWTTWKVRAGGEVCRTIDYVFFGPDTLRPTAVLAPPPRDQVESGRLPSWRYPSDHLSLLTRFEPTRGMSP